MPRVALILCNRWIYSVYVTKGRRTNTYINLLSSLKWYSSDQYWLHYTTIHSYKYWTYAILYPRIIFSNVTFEFLLGAAGYDVVFVHPKSAVGVLVELVQAPDDVIQALSKK